MSNPFDPFEGEQDSAVNPKLWPGHPWVPGMLAKDPQTGRLWRFAHRLAPRTGLWVADNGQLMRDQFVGPCESVTTLTTTAEEAAVQREDAFSFARARSAGPHTDDALTATYIHRTGQK